jgi:hypothetical protein
MRHLRARHRERVDLVERAQELRRASLAHDVVDAQRSSCARSTRSTRSR